MTIDNGERVAQLAADCRSANWSDLADSIDSIQRFVEKWWPQALMPWFTDHGVAHSRRVAEYALKIADVPDLSKPHALSVLERYILWAASWLHDLGMQSLPGTALGALQAIDFERVRHDHPDQSAVEIKARAAEIGLPINDAPLIQVIAWVARAHGTSYYADTLKLLELVPDVRNETVRGGLLASILLLADEMDLHYERVAPLPPAWTALSAVADAHAFKHRQVVASQPVHVAGDVVLSIKLAQSDEVGDDDALAVEKWITHKLRRQIAMIEAAFSGGFNGRVQLSRNVAVTRTKGWGSSTLPGLSSMNTIHADNARSDLINHSHALGQIEDAISRREFVALVGPLVEFVDTDGREDLLHAAASRARMGGAMVVECSFLYESRGAATVADICQAWVQQLDPENASDDFEGLALALGKINSQVVLTLTSADLLPAHELTALLNRLRISATKTDLSLLVTVADAAPPGVFDSEVEVGGLLKEDVTSYLAAFVSWQVARSEASANLKYADYKQLSQHHLLDHEVGN